MKGERILIIGGCGYLGSKLFIYLKNKKFDVTTVDLEWFGNYVNPKNIKMDYSLLTLSFLKKFSAIILLAGHSNYYMCEKDILGSFKNNVVNFVELLQKITTQKLIYASSSTVYENSGRKIADEEVVNFNPLSYYDLSKHTIDHYAILSGKKIYGLRMGTVSGYSPNLRIDLIINRLVENVLKNEQLSIHNPSILRAVLGIEDFCAAVEAIIKNDGKPGIYNLSSFNMQIKIVAKRVLKYFKKNEIKVIKRPMIPSFKLSSKKFEKEFDFTFKENVESIIDSLLLTSNTPKSVRK